MLGWMDVLRVYSACHLWRNLEEACLYRPRGFNILSQYPLCICSGFRIWCVQLSTDSVFGYDGVSRSLRFLTRMWNYSPLPRELMFFSFQICLGSADSHTLVYFFCVVFYGVCTKWESYNNEFHFITFIKKQITLVCVPRVFEFIDMILFQYSSVQHFLK